MQPNTTITTPNVRRGLAAAALAAALLLVGCSSSSDDSSAKEPSGATTAAADAGTDTGTDGGSGDTTTSAADGTPTVDVCSEITAEDVQAILTGADPITAAPNAAMTVPSCDYSIQIGGGGTTMDAAVVQILWASADAAYYDSQKELQTDAVELTGVDQGFSYDDSGTIVMTTDAGVWTIERGVELTNGGTEPASAAQMEAIAALVQERL